MNTKNPVKVCDRILNLMNCPLRADKPISTLIAHNYPEQKTNAKESRAGAHTDFGTFDSSIDWRTKPGGLQVMWIR